MKKFLLLGILSLYIVLWACNSSNKNNSEDTVQINKKEYNVDKLSDWNYRTTENIKHIPEWVSKNSTWCYDSNSENCQNYWRLYEYEAALKACESLGDWWQLPSDKDWRKLEYSLWCDKEDLEKNQMQDMWCDIESQEDSEWRCSELIDNDEELILFDWFIDGLAWYRVFLGDFNRLDEAWYWWTSTRSKDPYTQEKRTWIRSIEKNSNSIIRNIENKENWYSVRCIKK